MITFEQAEAVQIFNMLAVAQQKGAYLSLTHQEQKDILDMMINIKAKIQSFSDTQGKSVPKDVAK